MNARGQFTSLCALSRRTIENHSLLHAQTPHVTRQSLMKKIFAILAVTLSVSAIPSTGFADDCPKKIRVEAHTFSSLSSSDSSVLDRIFQSGDGQSDRAYIQEILRTAETLSAVDAVLSYSPTNSRRLGGCVYRGPGLKLRIARTSVRRDHGYVAELKLGRVDYVSDHGGNPSSHHGNALSLTTHFSAVSASALIPAARRVSSLSFELLVQVPMGDYGTDGYYEPIEIGRADTVRYSIVE